MAETEATLRLAIDGRPVVDASAQLRQFTVVAAQAETATKQLATAARDEATSRVQQILRNKEYVDALRKQGLSAAEARQELRLLVAAEKDEAEALRAVTRAREEAERAAAKQTVAMEAATVSAKKAELGFGGLVRPLVSFVDRLDGVPPVIGRLVGSLSTFAVGGATTVAVVGGLAILSEGLALLTADFRKSEQAADDAAKAYKRAADARKTAVQSASEQIVATRQSASTFDAVAQTADLIGALTGGGALAQGVARYARGRAQARRGELAQAGPLLDDAAREAMRHQVDLLAGARDLDPANTRVAQQARDLAAQYREMAAGLGILNPRAQEYLDYANRLTAADDKAAKAANAHTRAIERLGDRQAAVRQQFAAAIASLTPGQDDDSLTRLAGLQQQARAAGLPSGVIATLSDQYQRALFARENAKFFATIERETRTATGRMTASAVRSAQPGLRQVDAVLDAQQGVRDEEGRTRAMLQGDAALREYNLKLQIRNALERAGLTLTEQSTEQEKQRAQQIETSIRAAAEQQRWQAFITRVRTDLEGVATDFFDRFLETGRITLGKFFDDLKRMILRTFAEILAKEVTQKIIQLLSALATAGSGGSGPGGTATSFAAVGAFALGGGALGLGARGSNGAGAGGGVPGGLLGLLKGSPIASGVASAGLGGLIGYNLGGAYGTGAGIAGGALAGAGIGFALGGPVGAIVGGAAGLIGGLFGGRKRKEQKKEEAREYAAALQELQVRTLQAAGDDVGAQKLQLQLDQQQELKAAIDKYGASSDYVRQLRTTQAAEMSRLAYSTTPAGVYLAPSGFDAAGYRFDAGRGGLPLGPNGGLPPDAMRGVAIDTVNITVPDGTPREQALAFVSELRQVSLAQYGRTDRWAEVQPQ